MDVLSTMVNDVPCLSYTLCLEIVAKNSETITLSKMF